MEYRADPHPGPAQPRAPGCNLQCKQRQPELAIGLAPRPNTGDEPANVELFAQEIMQDRGARRRVAPVEPFDDDLIV